MSGINNPSGGGGAVTREGGNTTEATTTSTSATDLLGATSLSIAVAVPIRATVSFRKTSGASDNAGLGLKLNNTVVTEGATLDDMGKTSATDQAEARFTSVWLGPRIANYLRSGIVLATAGVTGNASVGGTPVKTNDMPAAIITSFIIRGITDNALNTLGADELHIYSLAAS